MQNEVAENVVGAGQNAAHQLTETATRSTNVVMDSFQDAASQIIILVPKAFFAVLVLVIGYFVARLVAKAITALCDKLGLQKAAESGGLIESMKQVGVERTVPEIIGTIVFWLFLCVCLVAAFDILDLPAIRDPRTVGTEVIGMRALCMLAA